MIDAPHPFDFFDRLMWLDGRPLMSTIEPYRRDIFESVLWTFDDDGRPAINIALCGRGKKNWKTADLALAALYRFLAWPSPAGNDSFVLANDQEQAGDDLEVIKKILIVNPIVGNMVDTQATRIVRKDGRGALQILPARDAIGSHGKTYNFIGYDEIHGYRNHDLFEALAPDPTRLDALTWITSYAGIRHAPGIPLYDFMQAGKAGDDPRMYFSWYAGDFTTDPAFADATPEDRANPSKASWGNDGYLAQQRRRLPTVQYRRLHLNLPGAPSGAALDYEGVMRSIAPGRRNIPPEPGRAYHGFVDMSGGSSDDAVLGIAHHDKAAKRTVLDLLECQAGGVPFHPRKAVNKFAALLKNYGLSRVTGDDYGGETFKADFDENGIRYESIGVPKSELYEQVEPRLNAGEVELLDIPKLQEQLLTLVWRGTKIDHQPGDHDDFANAVAGAINLAAGSVRSRAMTQEYLDALRAAGTQVQHARGRPYITRNNRRLTA